MAWQFFDALATFVARLLEIIFLVGSGGTAVVIVLTVLDIVRDTFTPDTIAKHEIDALGRAA